MQLEQKHFKLFAAISGFLAVTFGAFAAHSLKNTLSVYALDIWKTAVLYQIFHTLVIVALSYSTKITNDSESEVGDQKTSKFVVAAQVWFALGIIVFCGSLYVLAITGITKLGMVTPLGGACFLIGWLYLIINAVKS